MDVCFVCRWPCARRACTRCTLFAHNKCWLQFLGHSDTGYSKVHQRCVSCPQCKGVIVLEKHITRSVRKAMHARMNFMRQVGESILNISRESSRGGKLREAVLLFEYICQMSHLLRECSRLHATLEFKLRELYIVDGWECAAGFYERLFGARLEPRITHVTHVTHVYP